MERADSERNLAARKAVAIEIRELNPTNLNRDRLYPHRSTFAASTDLMNVWRNPASWGRNTVAPTAGEATSRAARVFGGFSGGGESGAPNSSPPARRVQSRADVRKVQMSRASKKAVRSVSPRRNATKHRLPERFSVELASLANLVVDLYRSRVNAP